MDVWGRYPGSIVKKLRVEGDALVEGDLTVLGDINGSGSDVTCDQLYTKDGTEALPAWSFKDEKDLGIYRPAAHEVAVTSRGIKRARVTDTSADFYVPVSALGVSSDGDVQSTQSVRAFNKVEGEYHDFREDPDNSKLWYDSTDDQTRVKIQVNGDPSAGFGPKLITSWTGYFADHVDTPKVYATDADIFGKLTTTTGKSFIGNDGAQYPTFSRNGVDFSSANKCVGIAGDDGAYTYNTYWDDTTGDWKNTRTGRGAFIKQESKTGNLVINLSLNAPSGTDQDLKFGAPQLTLSPSGDLTIPGTISSSTTSCYWRGPMLETKYTTTDNYITIPLQAATDSKNVTYTGSPFYQLNLAIAGWYLLSWYAIANTSATGIFTRITVNADAKAGTFMPVVGPVNTQIILNPCNLWYCPANSLITFVMGWNGTQTTTLNSTQVHVRLLST